MATVLVVDDEPTIRMLLLAALEGTDHLLLEAADGRSALGLARSSRPDLILLDIALPGLSGLDVCRELKQDPTTADVPVLLLTGLARQDERQVADDVGAEGFIAKPFSPVALVAEIEEILRRRATVLSR